jgi:hypothetical protein
MTENTGRLLEQALDTMTQLGTAPSPQMDKEEKKRLLTEGLSPEKIAIVDGARERFIEIWENKVVPARGEQATKMMRYLDGKNCDFFITPASARSHGSHYGGLVLHSLNVYYCLLDVLSSEIYKRIGLTPSDDTIAIVSLLHDLCKANFYAIEVRNRKNKAGQWEPYPFITYNDSFPYGHGEKSAYMISKFMDLSAEETMAIRYHMGFSDCADENARRHYTQAAHKYPLCVAMSEADTRAAILLEGFGVNQRLADTH